MTVPPDAAPVLLQSGLLIAAVLLLQAYAVRHLPVETIPGVLRHRVALANRFRPWLVALAMTMAGVGLVLHL